MLDAPRSTDSNRVSRRARGGRAFSIEFSLRPRSARDLEARACAVGLLEASRSTLGEIADSNSEFFRLSLSLSLSFVTEFVSSVGINARRHCGQTRTFLIRFNAILNRCRRKIPLGRDPLPLSGISLVVRGKLNDTSVNEGSAHSSSPSVLH